ncbi:hypothetical protein AALP_AA2G008000 [Arabis alpina]|uniref:Uncharacterized protein n=1 Tax=Arabis alpina TaxID=50452 RepID=A0A087HEI0_ARAAL|nr:hypothetical protein AALP_AA2G008000 [Arabis alpina]
MGVKAAKAKEKKRGQGKIEEAKGPGSLKVLSQVWEIRDKDNAAQEMLSNQKILEGLLAKPGVLSEMEVHLKNTLMSDMLKRLGKNPVEEGQG